MFLQAASSWLDDRVQKEATLSHKASGSLREAGMRATGFSSYMLPKDGLFYKAGHPGTARDTGVLFLLRPQYESRKP